MGDLYTRLNGKEQIYSSQLNFPNILDFIDGAVIDFWAAHLIDKCNLRDKFYCANTPWLPRFDDKKTFEDFENVGENFYHCDVLFLPLNYRNVHWRLMVIWRKDDENEDEISFNFEAFYFESIKNSFNALIDDHNNSMKEIEFLKSFMNHIL